MKTNILFFFLALTLTFGQVCAQTIVNQPLIKKIEVTGSAAMEITPDEIYFNITLKEYLSDKSGKVKITIETLEKQLQQAVREAGLAKEDLQIENIFGGTPQWWYNKKEKPADLLEKKLYVLKVSDVSKIDNIVAKVDGKGIESINISRYTHSKIASYRKELKIKALQAAKEKAAYLLQSIGEQVGGILEIREAGDNEGLPVPYQQNYLSNMSAQTLTDASDSEVDFKKIKLRYEVQAVFTIK